MKYIYHLILSMLIFWACTSLNRDQIIFEEFKNPEILSLPQSSLQLTKEKAKDIALNIQWNVAEYGDVVLATRYALQFDITNDFTNPHTVVVGAGELEYTLTNQTLSEISVIKLGQTPGVPFNLNMRVRATVNEDIDTLYSEIRSIEVVPYDPYVRLFLVIGGDKNKPASVFAPNPAQSSTDFEAYVFLPSQSSFEFYQNLGETAIGGTMSSPSDISNIQLTSGGSAISTPSEGVYKMNIDLAAMTCILVRIDSWGVIGSSTSGGWSTDTNFTYDVEQDTYIIDSIDLIPGEFKFRANDDWGINLGGQQNKLNYSGDNIALGEGGSYKIVLNLSNSNSYSYLLIKK